MSVFVLDKRKKPLAPCSERRARVLLGRGRARVHRRHPFTIRLVDRRVEESEIPVLVLKFDPGSVSTGAALVRQSGSGEMVVDENGEDTGGPVHRVLALFELRHRGRAISMALTARRAHRRFRRARLRFRAARFDNRARPAGWLAPSLRHRVEGAANLARMLCRLAPVARLCTEVARFDIQALQDPEISGAEYQRGTLFEKEVREYVLEKWGRRCAYCEAAGVPLEVEHIVPRARGGSNRASNLALACVPCNRAKGATSVEVFVRDPVRLARILAHAKRPLRDAAAMNATRHATCRALEAATDLPVETATGGRTRWNRSRFGVPKAHALDAACAGRVSGLESWRVPTLAIAATGRGRYRRAVLDRFGFPRGHSTRSKRVHGFATGDLVRAVVPSGKKAGVHLGRVAVRVSGIFNVNTSRGLMQGIAHRHCTMVARGDGYEYGWIPRTAFPPPPEEQSFHAGKEG